MLYPVGFKPEDFSKPVIGIASSWSMVTPCNMHLDQLARIAEAGANEAGGKAIIFDTITVSDGISMGTEGMKYSLVSREVIADSVELTVRGHSYDALVGLAGCDKSLPGMMMAMCRLNVPSIFIYGGSILPGTFKGRPVTVQDVFEAVGKYSVGDMSDADLETLNVEHFPMVPGLKPAFR